MRLSTVVLIGCLVSSTIGLYCIKNDAGTKTSELCVGAAKCWRSADGGTYGCGTECGADKTCEVEDCDSEDFCNIEATDYVCAADKMDGMHVFDTDKATYEVCSEGTKLCTIVLPKNADTNKIATTCGAPAATCTSAALDGCLQCAPTDDKVACNAIDATKFKACYTSLNAATGGASSEKCAKADEYAAAANSDGDFLPKCQRPTKSGGAAAWGCGDCTGDTVADCASCDDGDNCNGANLNQCVKYTFSVDTYTRAADAIYCADSGCHRPLIGEDAASENDGCGECPDGQDDTKCQACSAGAECNKLDCVKWDGETGSYDAGVVQECSIEAKCSRPLFTYGLVPATSDDVIQYKCGKCADATEDTCKDCEGEKCNIKPAGDASKKCFTYTWTETKYVLSDAAAVCDLGDKTSLICSKPNVLETEADFTTGKGCGPCPVAGAGKCTECSEDACNGAGRLTFVLLPILMALYFLW